MREDDPLVRALFIIQDKEPSNVVTTNSATPAQSHEDDGIRVLSQIVDLFTEHSVRACLQARVKERYG